MRRVASYVFGLEPAPGTGLPGLKPSCHFALPGGNLSLGQATWGFGHPTLEPRAPGSAELA